MKRYKNAIVRRPSKNLIHGLTSAGMGLPDFDVAQKQHDRYIETLEKCGLQVTVMDADENFPDSVFIEDVALLTPKMAVITRPGAPSRRGEVAGIENILSRFYPNIETISAPGTIEAGDIMQVGSHFYIGLSERTNLNGTKQMITILEKYGLTGSMVNLENVLHLKTGMSYLENNNLLVAGEFILKKEFADFHKILIDDDESYAANSLWINGQVLVPAGFPGTADKITSAGYKVIEVDVSEFQKLDGGLSCLSLRF